MAKIAPFVIAIVAWAAWYTIKANPVEEFDRWRAFRQHIIRDSQVMFDRVLDVNGFKVPLEIKKKMILCTSERVIEGLGKTSCGIEPFEFLKGAKQARAHVFDQSRCLRRHGFPDKSLTFFKQCGREHMPDDWSLLDGALKLEITKLYMKRGEGADRAAALAECAVPKMFELFTQTGCHVVYKDPKHPRIFGTARQCLREHHLGPIVEKIHEGCQQETP